MELKQRFFFQNCSWQYKVVSIDIPADEVLNSENVYGPSFPDSMIQKFSKNGKLKLSVAIDPINPVSTMVPNKSSTKNTATESNKPNSSSLVSIDHELLAQEASKWQSFHNRWIRTRDGGLKKGIMTSLTFLILKRKSFKNVKSLVKYIFASLSS